MTTATVISHTPAPAEASTHAVNGNYYLSIGYLRAFVTLLVLAHHSVLAYLIIQIRVASLP